jgi:hypothetical protein
MKQAAVYYIHHKEASENLIAGKDVGDIDLL